MRKKPSVRSIALISVFILFIGSNISAIADEEKGKENIMQYPQVLLEDDVKEFHDLIGRFGHHAVAVGDEVYTQPCVYLSLHLVQMRSAGWKDMDFDQIAAVSGASALFAYEPGEFMPKYANLSIGMDDRIAEATGFGYEWVNFDDLNGAWNLVKESVDSKKSVKGWDWENIMFVGYQEADKPEDRKIYAMADGPDTFSKWWTWEEFGEYIKRLKQMKQLNNMKFGRHTERVATKPADEVALRVIKDLIEWSVNPPKHLLERYPKATFGLAGIELYGEHCADMDKFEDFGSCHDINPQWPIRNSTSVYLRRLAEGDVFPGRLDRYLIKASKEYKASYIYWKQFYNHLSYGGAEGWGKIAEHRIAGAEGLRKALEHEKSALAILEEFPIVKDESVLNDLAYKERMTTHLGCLESACEYLGLDVTPAWLYGGTGHAFVMCLTGDLCPSGPHCWNQKSIHILSRNLPFRIEGVAGPKATPELLEKAWNYVHKSITDGYPCYGWHYEWVLVKGYDESGYLYSGCIEPPKEWNKFGADAIGFLELYSVRPDEPASDAKIIRDSLAFAISWADSPQKWAMEGYSGGLDAYDTWIKGISSGEAAYQELTYHAAIWAECRGFAAQFLEEANKRTEKKYDTLLQPAIDSYKIVAECIENIRQMAPLPNWPLSDADKEMLKAKKIDDDMRNSIVTELEKAKQAEAKGLEKFREIVAVLNDELGDGPPEF